MEGKTFAELMASAGEALDHAKGKLALKTTVLRESPIPMSASEIKLVRKKLNASQAVFAHYLNISPKLVQAWESKRRQPQGPALLLLWIVKESPSSVLQAFPKTPRKARVAAPTKR